MVGRRGAEKKLPLKVLRFISSMLRWRKPPRRRRSAGRIAIYWFHPMFACGAPYGSLEQIKVKTEVELRLRFPTSLFRLK